MAHTANVDSIPSRPDCGPIKQTDTRTTGTQSRFPFQKWFGSVAHWPMCSVQPRRPNAEAGFAHPGLELLTRLHQSTSMSTRTKTSLCDIAPSTIEHKQCTQLGFLWFFFLRMSFARIYHYLVIILQPLDFVDCPMTHWQWVSNRKKIVGNGNVWRIESKLICRYRTNQAGGKAFWQQTQSNIANWHRQLREASYSKTVMASERLITTTCVCLFFAEGGREQLNQFAVIKNTLQHSDLFDFIVPALQSDSTVPSVTDSRYQKVC